MKLYNSLRLVSGFIEDAGPQRLHVTFSSRKMGGGFLTTGSLQVKLLLWAECFSILRRAIQWACLLTLRFSFN